MAQPGCCAPRRRSVPRTGLERSLRGGRFACPLRWLWPLGVVSAHKEVFPVAHLRKLMLEEPEDAKGHLPMARLRTPQQAASKDPAGRGVSATLPDDLSRLPTAARQSRNTSCFLKGESCAVDQRFSDHSTFQQTAGPWQGRRFFATETPWAMP